MDRIETPPGCRSHIALATLALFRRPAEVLVEPVFLCRIPLGCLAARLCLAAVVFALIFAEPELLEDATFPMVQVSAMLGMPRKGLVLQRSNIASSFQAPPTVNLSDCALLCKFYMCVVRIRFLAETLYRDRCSAVEG